jgi:hypothetical protein
VELVIYTYSTIISKHSIVCWLVLCLLVFWLKFCLHFSSVHISCPGETESLNNPPSNQETHLWPHHSCVWNQCHTFQFTIIWYWKSLCYRKFGVKNWILCKIWDSHSSVEDLSLLRHDAVSTDMLVGKDVTLFDWALSFIHVAGRKYSAVHSRTTYLEWPLAHSASYEVVSTIFQTGATMCAALVVAQSTNPNRPNCEFWVLLQCFAATAWKRAKTLPWTLVRADLASSPSQRPVSHTSILTQQFLEKNKMAVLPHLPYSPDLAISKQIVKTVRFDELTL